MATTVKTTAKANAPKKEVIRPTIRAEIKRKAEAGIALDNTTPAKAKLYAQDQARIKYLVGQRAKSGESLSESNDYKDGLLVDARKNLKVGDKSYYNPDNVMLRQGGEDDSRLSAMMSMLQKGSDASMKSQTALLGQARDKQISDIQKALEDAVSEGKISVREAEEQFEANKAEIDKQSYQDNERTELVSQDRGIQNSAQSIGLMQGDNARKNSLINTNMTTRDKRVADISDRLANITNKSKLDTSNANANYGYGVANAQGQVDAQMAQNQFSMNMEDYKMDREQQFGLDQAGMQNKFQQDAMARQQKYQQDNMAQQQGYTQDNMQTAQNFDLAKMSKQQNYTLEQMAKSFGYDLSKMSKAQQYQLTNMATSFGYDMSMQNDAQGFQSGENSLNRNHDSNMQDDAQSFQSYQAEQSRTHEVNMFGRQEASKLAEYDTALKREMSSYDANTPEGKLRIKQLESAQSALLTEKMTGVIGEVMGQEFVKKYGEGMTPEQMQKWLKNPTNLKLLESKTKSSKLPAEKKSAITMFKDAVIKFTAPGKIYEAYSKMFRDGLPSFTP